MRKCGWGGVACMPKQVQSAIPRLPPPAEVWSLLCTKKAKIKRLEGACQNVPWHRQLDRQPQRFPWSSFQETPHDPSQGTLSGAGGGGGTRRGGGGTLATPVHDPASPLLGHKQSPTVQPSVSQWWGALTVSTTQPQAYRCHYPCHDSSHRCPFTPRAEGSEPRSTGWPNPR